MMMMAVESTPSAASSVCCSYDGVSQSEDCLSSPSYSVATSARKGGGVKGRRSRRMHRLAASLKSPPVCSLSLILSMSILIFTLLICCPIAIWQGTMNFPLFHPSMAFTAPPEQYFATTLLPLSGGFWFLFSFALWRGAKQILEKEQLSTEDCTVPASSLVKSLLSRSRRTSPLSKGRLLNHCSLVFSIISFVSLIGVGSVPVLSNKEVHDLFAKVCFGFAALQCLVYCLLDSYIADAMMVSKRLRRVRVALAFLMAFSALEVNIGIIISRNHNLGNYFGLVAGGEWLFLSGIFGFITSSWPHARFIDHCARHVYLPVAIPQDIEATSSKAASTAPSSTYDQMMLQDTTTSTRSTPLPEDKRQTTTNIE